MINKDDWQPRFTQWMAQVNRRMVAVVGVTAGDLPDQTWADWFDDEISPNEAVRMFLEEEGLDRHH